MSKLSDLDTKTVVDVAEVLRQMVEQVKRHAPVRAADGVSWVMPEGFKPEDVIWTPPAEWPPVLK